MPSFKIYLSDWNGIIECSIPKMVEADSQFQAIVQYMSEMEKNDLATHIVVTGGLSRNLRVFTVREFTESMARKPYLVISNDKTAKSFGDSKIRKNDFKPDPYLIGTKDSQLVIETDKFNLGLNQFIVCLFRNGLQFTQLLRIDGESYSDALDQFLRTTKDKVGSFLHENNIWIKNAYGDNKWCKINNLYAIEYSNNIRYQRALKENNSIEITVFNSKYRDAAENKFKVVAHDAADAFRLYCESHKEESYPVSLFYLNDTTKESRYFDSSDYLVFVRGINSTKNVDHLLFNQFEIKDYSTIEYLFRLNTETHQKHKQIVQSKSEKTSNIKPESNNNKSSIISDCFEVFECKNENYNKHGIWALLSWPLWIFVSAQLVKEVGKNRLSNIFDSAILYLAGGGFLIGILYFIGWIDRNRLKLKIKLITSFVDRYPILYPPYFCIYYFLLSPWIMIGCFIIVMFLSALFSGGGRYSE